MLHKKIRIPKDSEVEVMEELGKLDESIQFVDLNTNDFEQRKIYSNMITRCEEAGKRIQTFENICNMYEEKIIRYNNYQTFKIDLENDMKSLKKKKFKSIKIETRIMNKKQFLKKIVQMILK